MTADRSWIPDEVRLCGNDSELARIREAIARGPFEATWESLAGYQIPAWYEDAKFGIFLHWGVYSVPAFGNEWYARNMYREGTAEFAHHLATYGPHAEFGYKDFIPSFTMADFDPDDWASLFRRSGAQYIVPVAEHHDGFCLYDEPRTRWTAPKMGPRRDVFGDLVEALDRVYLVSGASSHRAEHWFYMNGGARFDSDVRDPRYADFYGPAQREETGPSEAYLEDWLLRTVRVIDRYRPQLLYFDWWIEHPAFAPYLRTLAAYYYNQAAGWGRGVGINYKYAAFRAGTAVFDVERGAEPGIRRPLWQNDTSVSRNSWGYIEGHDYKSVSDILGELMDVVAKGGALLVNIGPKPDGTIAPVERAMLGEIGDWLNVNREAVYGTRPWIQYGEGPTAVPTGPFADAHPVQLTSQDIRFTTRDVGDLVYLYATTTVWPEDGEFAIRALGAASGVDIDPIHEITILGHDGPVEWRREPEALVISLPERRPSAHGVAVRLDLRPAPPAPRSEYLHG